MFLSSLRSPHTRWIAGFCAGITLSGAALAQNASPAAPAAPAASTPPAAAAPALPPPNPAAEKALQQHFQVIYAALEGKGAMPDAKSFTDDFNKQVNAAQLKQVFEQVHKTVGACRIAGQLKGPVSFVSSYLLQCDKGFVPMDIAVEDAAPYRVHSLLIRPGYAKL